MRDITQKEISDFLKNMRASIGFDQEALAKRLNIKSSEIMEYEACISTPDDPYAFTYDLRQVVKQEIQSRKR